MNMLIIGNGFDLAHGRPTKYEDFLVFIQQIMRIKTFDGTKDEFEATLPDLHTEVKKYILSAFEINEAKSDPAYEMLKEMYDCLEENIWYEYFQIIVQKDKVRGKGWIDFESEIQEIIKFFDERFHDLFEPFSIPATEARTLSSKIRIFYSKLMFSKFNATKGRNEGYKVTCSDFIEKTYQDLEHLIRCLEIYLDDCIGKMSISCCSPDIRELQVDSVLSFNYTEIPTNIYPSLTNTHYIHGFAEVKRPASENNMVLGVNEYWEGIDKDTHTNFNLYKKFVQRIIKETGIGYKRALKYMCSDGNKVRTVREGNNSGSPYINHVYIFGHSLDVTDGDILREVIKADDADTDTTIFYRNKQQQANQIANLSKVLGQDELLKRTFSISPTIIFKQQAEMVAR